ncbi:MAG: TlyA family RNA methyltransferase [Pseudomonadota bacterium]
MVQGGSIPWIHFPYAEHGWMIMPPGKSEKIRLDLLLVKQGLAESREKARGMIMAGLVQVDDRILDKPGHLVPLSSSISLKKPYPPYVSRGGLKLEAALDRFAIHVKGKVLLDVGSSTGGFTDCLLQRGAQRVIAVDVGYGQFHWKLRQDPRVTLLEKRNIRYLKPEELNTRAQGAVIDVSFISLRLVIPPVSDLLAPDAFVLALIKPQFEVGKDQVGKGGVVRDASLHHEVIHLLSTFAEGLGWHVIGHMTSPLTGPKGNKEFFLYLKR